MACSKTAMEEEEGDEEDLTLCSICLSLIEQPKALPCLHTYCFKCLSEWAKPESTTVSCPMCRKECILPSGGVADLENNFFVTKLKDRKAVHKKLASKDCMIPCTSCEGSNQPAIARCVECDDFLCETCLKSHKTMRLLKGHHTFTLDELRSGKADPVEKVEYCKKHKEQILWIFCETCDTLICRDCTVFDHCKPEHIFVELESATTSHRKKIKELALECKKLSLQVDADISNDDDIVNKIETSALQALSDLTRSYEETKSSFLASLNKRRDELAEEISQLKAERCKVIAAHKEDLLGLHLQLRTALEMATQLIQTGSDYDVAQMYAPLTGSLQHLRGEKRPSLMKKNTNQITFKPKVQGAELGSVSSVSTTRNWKFADVSESLKDSMNCLSTVAVTNNGLIYSVEWGNRLILYESNGKLKKKISKISSAFGIALNSAGEIFITSGGFVQVFDNSITFKRKFAVKSPNGKLSSEENSTLRSLSFNTDGHVVVGETNHRYISVHEQQGSYKNSFNVIVHPCYIVVNSVNQLIISCGQDRIGCISKCCPTLLDESGKILRVFDSPLALGSPWSPTGICCSVYDDLYIANKNGEKGVHRYSASGDYEGCIIKGLNSPNGIFMTENENLFITDDKHVKIYQPSL